MHFPLDSSSNGLITDGDGIGNNTEQMMDGDGQLSTSEDAL